LKQEASLYVTEDATEKYVDMVEKSVDETLENNNHGTISIYKDQKVTNGRVFFYYILQ
jgi:hypothetical protein